MTQSPRKGTLPTQFTFPISILTYDRKTPAKSTKKESKPAKAPKVVEEKVEDKEKEES